ncbi:MAG: HAD-IIB family hydrolase [Ruminococcus sp.]
MQKVIFFDIDGTLITEDERKIIPDSTRKAIALARRNGHLTFVNTGRTLFHVSHDVRELGFDGMLCGCGTYIEYGGNELFYNRLSTELCRKIADSMRECGAAPVYERRDCLFFDRFYDNCPQIVDFRENFLTPDVSASHHTDDVDFSFDKFVVFTDENTDIASFRRIVGENFDIIDRGGGFFENVPHGCSKATAIDFILKKLGIPLENAYAIGDSMNDLPMFRAVPNSIAMGNGETVFPYVSYITAPILEDGIEKALKHFGII